MLYSSVVITLFSLTAGIATAAPASSLHARGSPVGAGLEMATEAFGAGEAALEDTFNKLGGSVKQSFEDLENSQLSSSPDDGAAYGSSHYMGADNFELSDSEDGFYQSGVDPDPIIQRPDNPQDWDSWEGDDDPMDLQVQYGDAEPQTESAFSKMTPPQLESIHQVYRESVNAMTPEGQKLMADIRAGDISIDEFRTKVATLDAPDQQAVTSIQKVVAKESKLSWVLGPVGLAIFAGSVGGIVGAIVN